MMKNDIFRLLTFKENLYMFHHSCIHLSYVLSTDTHVWRHFQPEIEELKKHKHENSYEAILM